MNHEIWVKIINSRLYIKMINIRKLKRICALNSIHLYHERDSTVKGYYISINQTNDFIQAMNNSSINVNFIGKGVTECY